jgi:hypothetical protein
VKAIIRQKLAASKRRLDLKQASADGSVSRDRGGWARRTVSAGSELSLGSTILSSVHRHFLFLSA